jgi:signal transduction histidine kinase
MEITLRILSLEDDEDDFEFIHETLDASDLKFSIKRVDTKEGFINALENYKPHVILSDHSLPKFNSTDALEICKRNHIQTPFILVTGAVSDEFAVNSIQHGANDYILKSNLNRLPSAIKNALKHRETEIAKQRAIASLESQNEKLLKINKELDSFVYSVSHNLRAPLMSVLGLLDLAKREPSNDNLQQYHLMMQNSIQKLDETLKGILEYSRNTRQDLKIEKIDFKELIKESLDKLQFMTGFEHLDINVTGGDQSPFYADYYRVSVVVNNILSNAIKYLDVKKEKPFFSVTIDVNDKIATLIFADNGIGIDKALLPKVFHMFFRATDKKEGSGLGLYIVKEAIDLLKGQIEIESEFGKGTTFKILIPNQAPQMEKIKMSGSGKSELAV